MSTISVCFKRITIIFLLFTFLLVSFFGTNIKTIKAQSGYPSSGSATPTVTTPVQAYPPVPSPTTTTPSSTTSASGTSVIEDCSKKCPQQSWNPFNVSSQIQSALCNTQCAIIGWEASIIGWVIEKVLYPSLGLCDDTKDNCPKLPTASGGSH